MTGSFEAESDKSDDLFEKNGTAHGARAGHFPAARPALHSVVKERTKVDILTAIPTLKDECWWKSEPFVPSIVEGLATSAAAGVSTSLDTNGVCKEGPP